MIYDEVIVYGGKCVLFTHYSFSGYLDRTISEEALNRNNQLGISNNEQVSETFLTEGFHNFQKNASPKLISDEAPVALPPAPSFYVTYVKLNANF